MSKSIMKALEENEAELVAVDKETAKKLVKIADETGATPSEIINAATQIIEKSLGRQIVIRGTDSLWDLKIDKFKKFKPLIKFEPDHE